MPKRRRNPQFSGVSKPEVRNIRRRTRQDTSFAYKPAYQELERQQRALGPLYEGIQNQLAPMTPAYLQSAQGMQNTYLEGLGGIAPMLGTGQAGQTLATGTATGSPAGFEQDAAAGVFGASGQGALGALAANQQRHLGYNQSASRQAELQKLAQQQELWRTGQDISQQEAMARKTRLDELLDQARQYGLAKQELDIRKLLGLKQVGLSQQELALASQQMQNDLKSARWTARALAGKKPKSNKNKGT